jgi:hypothetical protein
LLIFTPVLSEFGRCCETGAVNLQPKKIDLFSFAFSHPKSMILRASLTDESNEFARSRRPGYPLPRVSGAQFGADRSG